MNISFLLISAVILFYAGYRFYSAYLAKVWGEDNTRTTPAVALKDDVDYAPAKKGIVFSHYFASIAGAGPIIGPTVALIYGYAPVWLWVVLGGIFIGAVHDYSALFISLQEKGKSIAQISSSAMGRVGYILFITFTFTMIVLVTGAFLGLTATALTSVVSLKDMNIEGGSSILYTVVKDGKEVAQIGGIASTSVIIITLFAPLIGYLIYRRNMNLYYGSLLSIILLAFSVIAGIYFPVSIEPNLWMVIISVYCFIAAGAPVWLLLQPRDFINSFLLYFGISFLIIGAIAGGFAGLQINAPAFNMAEGSVKLGMLWPFLFITIACGAISGFHSLIGSGTVSKQVSCESDARPIAYGGMIIESLLAVTVIIAVGGGMSYSNYIDTVFPTAQGARSNPILAFSLGMGGLLNKGLGIPLSYGAIFGILMLEGFVITTLDTAVRLSRLLLEEFWSTIFKNPPAFLRSYYFNAGLSVFMMLYLAYTSKFLSIWPIFGAANQLLAALGLIAVTAWLIKNNKPALFTFFPALFMVATTLIALYSLLTEKYIPSKNITLMATDIILIILSIGVIILSINKLKKPQIASSLKSEKEPS